MTDDDLFAGAGRASHYEEGDGARPSPPPPWPRHSDPATYQAPPVYGVGAGGVPAPPPAPSTGHEGQPATQYGSAYGGQYGVPYGGQSAGQSAPFPDSYLPEGYRAAAQAQHQAPAAGQVGSPSGVAPQGRAGDAPARREAETADALTPERLLRRRAAVPESGWRRAVYRASGGRVNPGNSKDVVRRLQLQRDATARCTGQTRFVVVMSRKGGVGKTTTAALLGMTLAELRPDRVVALDANPDRGTLADRAPRTTNSTVLDVVASADTIGSFADMSRLVSRDDATRLDVIASETDPERARAFVGRDYKKVADLLSGYYSIVITDCGTDLTHDVMPTILEHADAVVVVAGAAVEEARLASETLDKLARVGDGRLAREAVVAIQSASSTPVHVEEVVSHFETRARAVVRVPRDEHLAEGSVIELGRLAGATRRAALELAASVVRGISDDVPTRQQHTH